MDITDVRVKLARNSAERLKAFCSVTLDDEFVVRDVKVVDGTNGLFVAMPSRKATVNCPTCRSSNPFRARFCGQCGGKLPPSIMPSDANRSERTKLHKDIAHPITPAFREKLQIRVIEAFRAECELAKDPDYAPVETEEHEHNHHHEPGPMVEPVMDSMSDSMSEPLPEAEMEPMEPVEEGVSEYDTLIADLKGGFREPGRDQYAESPARGEADGNRNVSRSQGDRGRDRVPSGRGGQRPAQPAGRTDGRGPDRSRGGNVSGPDSRGREGPREGSRGSAPRGSDSRGQRPAPQPQERRPPVERSESAPRMAPPAARTAPPPPRPAQPVAKSEPKPASQGVPATDYSAAREDEMEFGAGIL